MTNNNDEKTPIEALSQLSEAMDQESAAVAAVRVDDPVRSIEGSLTKFVRDSFAHVRESRSLQEEIGNEISIRKSEVTVPQLMDFYVKIQSGNTSGAATLITPIMGVQAARVQAEVETHQLPSSSSAFIEKAFKGANKDVLQGIVQLNQILEAMNTKAAEIVIDDKKPKT
jgi:hypothetical protein